MPHHIAMVMRRSRRAARARRVARAQSSLVAGRWAVAAAVVAAAALVAAAAWQALSLRVDWRVGLALDRDQSRYHVTAELTPPTVVAAWLRAAVEAPDSAARMVSWV